MQCPKCQFEQSDLHVECQRCGIIFGKFYERQQLNEESVHSLSSEEDVDTVEERHLVGFCCPIYGEGICCFSNITRADD